MSNSNWISLLLILPIFVVAVLSVVFWLKEGAAIAVKIGKNVVGFWRNDQGQDLVEYALMVAFIAVAAGAIMPGVAASLSCIYQKISWTMQHADAVVVGSYVCPVSIEAGWTRIACAVLGVLFLSVIVLRRKSGE